MKISIEKGIGLPLYKQIFEQVRSQILVGDILSGYRLPSERQLAKSLQVDRTTVLNAYRELKSEGLVDARVGRGTIVCGGTGHRQSFTADSPNWDFIINSHISCGNIPIDEEIIRIINRQDIPSFAGERICDTRVPEEVLGVHRNSAGDQKVEVPLEGYLPLRHAINQMIFENGNTCRSNARETIITRGGKHGIELVTYVLIKPGDIVLVEEPVYHQAPHIFQRAGARVKGIPMTGEGMNLNILSETLEKNRVKLIYTIPTGHNPCGITTTLKHRMKLLELACRHKAIILEDGPVWGTSPRDQLGNVPTLKALDQKGYVVLVGTFSKVISPRLEIGWVCAHERITDAIKPPLHLTSPHRNTVDQLLLLRAIENGKYQAHIEKLQKTDKRDEKLFRDALKAYPIEGLACPQKTEGPYKSLLLPEEIPATKLLKAASERGVIVLPGTFFCLDPRVGERFIRIVFRNVPEKDSKAGMMILMETIAELKREIG